VYHMDFTLFSLCPQEGEGFRNELVLEIQTSDFLLHNEAENTKKKHLNKHSSTLQFYQTCEVIRLKAIL
jgi:hypothetical protein